ncbi:hypothetical protein A2U01_0114459, partial [Trifolium medium]|nr:hypothetical protein [Trifolium medium]
MYVTVGSYGYVALVRRRERKTFGDVYNSLVFKFKQWDP